MRNSLTIKKLMIFSIIGTYKYKKYIILYYYYEFKIIIHTKI